MTSTKLGNEICKQDSRGRVRVTRERREALLEEFARSGLSGAAFARMAGIKYATFANWVQQRRKRAEGEGERAGTRAGTVRLVEAVVEDDELRKLGASSAVGLLVELPGGCRLRVESPVQLAMAAELISLVAQNDRVRC